MTDVSIYYTDNLETAHTVAPDAKYTLVLEWTVVRVPSHDSGVCEIVFAAMNHGSGREIPALDEKGLRSLSVGDIVKLRDDNGSRAYLCAPLGWEPIESWPMAEVAT